MLLRSLKHYCVIFFFFNFSLIVTITFHILIYHTDLNDEVSTILKKKTNNTTKTFGETKSILEVVGNSFTQQTTTEDMREAIATL